MRSRPGRCLSVGAAPKPRRSVLGVAGALLMSAFLRPPEDQTSARPPRWHRGLEIRPDASGRRPAPSYPPQPASTSARHLGRPLSWTHNGPSRARAAAPYLISVAYPHFPALWAARARPQGSEPWEILGSAAARRGRKRAITVPARPEAREPPRCTLRGFVEAGRLARLRLDVLDVSESPLGCAAMTVGLPGSEKR